MAFLRSPRAGICYPKKRSRVGGLCKELSNEMFCFSLMQKRCFILLGAPFIKPVGHKRSYPHVWPQSNVLELLFLGKLFYLDPDSGKTGCDCRPEWEAYYYAVNDKCYEQESKGPCPVGQYFAYNATSRTTECSCFKNFVYNPIQVPKHVRNITTKGKPQVDQAKRC